MEQARQAREQAEQAAEAKERFFANITHEIRTPLSGIAGSIELLQHAQLNADQRPLLAALATSSQNLVQLVNAILDHAKLRAGHAHVESAPLKLSQLALDLSDLYAARAADKGLRLSLHVHEDLPEWISCDEIKLKQIIGNLMANAIKFTERGAVKVRIQVGPADPAKQTRRLEVLVTDTGPGVPAHQLESIFDPFVQGDSSIARAHGGTGLGLAIGRQIAGLMGGSLGCVQSELGVGCVFRLLIPFAQSTGPDPASLSAPGLAADTRAARVLLAEDNPINRLVVVSMLTKLDAIVERADNGHEAVERACRMPFDLVLMDLQMPGLDGIAAARAIRAHESSQGRQRVPIVALTGNSAEDYREDCTAAGMDGFVLKPVSIDQLREVLARFARA